jgi:hypothetical protein
MNDGVKGDHFYKIAWPVAAIKLLLNNAIPSSATRTGGTRHTKNNCAVGYACNRARLNS